MNLIVIIFILVCIIIILVLNELSQRNTRGVLFINDIDYSLLNNKIKKVYIANRMITSGKTLGLFTRSISHHAFVLISDMFKCIVSRIGNIIHVIEVEQMNDKYAIGKDGLQYTLLEAFTLNDVTFGEFIDSGSKLCRLSKYSSLNHNCQEFVYDIVKEYKVIAEDDLTKYKGKLNLLLKCISEAINKQ